MCKYPHQILNALHGFGGVLFVAGLGMFLVGAGQVYYAKFSGKGAVTNGLYRFVRNPQYTALGVMGLGLLLGLAAVHRADHVLDDVVRVLFPGEAGRERVRRKI